MDVYTAVTENASVVSGPRDVPLLSFTLGELLEKQARLYGSREAIGFPQQKVRLTYQQLADRSKTVASSLLAAGLRHGDKVGIMAGNCYQYIEMFLAGGRIGCPVVVLNNTYSPQELLNAVSASDCKVLMMANFVGPRSLSDHMGLLRISKTKLKEIVLLGPAVDDQGGSSTPKIISYDDLLSRGASGIQSDDQVQRAEALVTADDVANVQFTSGTTGSPKAAMLTHINIINNGQFVGDRLNLEPCSIVCCPPPLFHCFGLVMGFLGAFTHGSSIIMPSDVFDPGATLDAIAAEKCTALLGVPTMFVAELELNRKKKLKITSVKTALAAGAPVPQAVMKMMDLEMSIKDILIAYGMTETSPVTFMTSLADSQERRLRTVGTVLPHTGAKIVDKEGNIVPRGVRGEICTSGYALQKGYYQNELKTKEVMKMDENGILWMYTGDEGVIDEDGYCSITGRIKDIIIRGGENIFPAEIEERLLAHTSIGEASVVGLPDEKYGEVVACFLRQVTTAPRPHSSEVSDWVRAALGRHKAPKHVLWIGDPGVGEDFPKTGSGKHQKHLLRDIGKRLIKPEPLKAML